MLRFILKIRYKDEHNGLENEWFETIDLEVDELECRLTGGGISENGYHTTDLIGVETLTD